MLEQTGQPAAAQQPQPGLVVGGQSDEWMGGSECSHQLTLAPIDCSNWHGCWAGSLKSNSRQVGTGGPTALLMSPDGWMKLGEHPAGSTLEV